MFLVSLPLFSQQPLRSRVDDILDLHRPASQLSREEPEVEHSSKGN